MNQDAPAVLAEPLPPAGPSTLRKIFIGKDGIRAGWSLLIFAIIFGLLAAPIVLIVRKFYHPPPAELHAITNATPTFVYANELPAFLLVAFVTWIMSKIERRPNSVYGFGGERKLPYFFAGLGWGVLCLSLLVLTLVKSGLLVIENRLLFGPDIFRYGTIWLGGFLFVGLLEEYLTRGYLQYTLTRGLAGLYQAIFKTRRSAALGFWTSATIFSLLFGLGHSSNPGESPIGLLSAGLVGLVFCFSLWRTGSLWWAIGFHAAWDWSQSFLYGVADSGLMAQHHLLATHPDGKPLLSGGTTGPEGSIFVLGALAFICLIIMFTLPRKEYAKNIKTA